MSILRWWGIDVKSVVRFLGVGCSRPHPVFTLSYYELITLDAVHLQQPISSGQEHHTLKPSSD